MEEGYVNLVLYHHPCWQVYLLFPKSGNCLKDFYLVWEDLGSLTHENVTIQKMMNFCKSPQQLQETSVGAAEQVLCQSPKEKDESHAVLTATSKSDERCTMRWDT